MSRVIVPLIDLNTGRAVAATLTVRKGRFAASDDLDESALRDAWKAVCGMNGGRPRWMFEEHVFTLDWGGKATRADGRSLGLAAGLALWGLWSGRPLTDDDGIAATGSMTAWGSVEIIRGIDAKIDASGAHKATKLLIPTGQLQRKTNHEMRVIPVSSLAEAAQMVGLPELNASPEVDDVSELEARIDKLMKAVQLQKLAAYRDRGLPPWVVLGRELEGLARMYSACQGEQDSDPQDTQVQQAYLAASSAYMYASDVGSAEAVLAYVDAPEVSSQLASLKNEIKLRRLLAHVDLDTVAIDPLIGACIESDKAGQISANGLGTIGRAYVHTGRPEEGLPYLERSRDAQSRSEVGRSEVYLATAYRVAGRFDAAHAALDRALQAHETKTRPYCGPYYRSCIMYWEYEKSRVLLEQAGRATAREGKALRKAAREHALMALGCCDALGLPVWPRVGILRLLCWADYHNGGWKTQLADLEAAYALKPGQIYRALYEEGLSEWSGEAQIW